MRIAKFSDLHVEFWKNKFRGQYLMPIKPDVIILAGDIAAGAKMYDWFLEKLTFLYPESEIIAVAGNHEYYGKGIISEVNDKLWDLQEKFSKFHFLNNQSIKIDDVVFIGSTLWTGYTYTADHVRCKLGISDFKEIYIKTGKLLDIPDVQAMHTESFDYIFGTLKTLFEEETKTKTKIKKVVITHHLPTSDSKDPSWAFNDPLNGAYVNNLNSEIDKLPADFWFHGHVHTSCNYKVFGRTQVWCNPFGYFGFKLNSEYNPKFLIDF